MLLLIVVHWHYSKHSWSAWKLTPKRTFRNSPPHSWVLRQSIWTLFEGIWLSLRVSNDVQKVIALFSVGLILIWFLESLSCNMFSTLSEIYFWKKWKRNTSLMKIQRTTKYFFFCWTISSGVKISPWNIQRVTFVRVQQRQLARRYWISTSIF